MNLNEAFAVVGEYFPDHSIDRSQAWRVQDGGCGVTYLKVPGQRGYVFTEGLEEVDGASFSERAHDVHLFAEGLPEQCSLTRLVRLDSLGFSGFSWERQEGCVNGS